MADAEISTAAVIAAAKARPLCRHSGWVREGGNPVPREARKLTKYGMFMWPRKHFTSLFHMHGMALLFDSIILNAKTLRKGKNLTATAPTVQGAQSRRT